MTRLELIEAAGLLQRILVLLLDAVPDRGVTAASALRRMTGQLAVDAETKIKGAALGTPLAACFDQARAAGATYQRFDAIRAKFQAEVPTGIPATAILQASIRLLLSQQARILAATTFTSREDIDATLAKVNVGFSDAIDFAADLGEGQMFQALVALHAAVVRDLTDRGRPLPRMVSLSFTRSLPTLSLANRLYGDAKRSDELVDENKIVHPLFAPMSLRALAS